MMKVVAPSHTGGGSAACVDPKHEPGDRPTVVTHSISCLLPPDATRHIFSVEKPGTEAGGPSKIAYRHGDRLTVIPMSNFEFVVFLFETSRVCRLNIGAHDHISG